MTNSMNASRNTANMIKVWLAALFFMGCTTLNTPDASTAPHVDRYLQAYAKSGFSGAILFAEGDRPGLHKGYGSMSTDEPMSTSAIWTIGSITKPMTAIAILQLEIQGKLSVEDRIDHHIDGLNSTVGAITIHQLLTHTSGLPAYSGRDDVYRSRSSLLAFIDSTELSAEPGTAFRYSNVGYSLLGVLIELASTMSYEAYLQAHIFEPADMRETGYTLPDWDTTRFAVGYRANGEKWGNIYDRNAYASQPGVSWNLMANGGLLSTHQDMLKWHMALKNENLLPASALKKMYKQHVVAPDDFSPFLEGSQGHYGYGWATAPAANGQRIIMHGGSNDIFVAGYMYYPENDIFYFITSNRQQFPASEAILDLDEIISNPSKVSLTNESKQNVVGQEYVGVYVFEDGSKVEIEEGDGPFRNTLIIRALDSIAWRAIMGRPLDDKAESAAKTLVDDLIEGSRTMEAIDMPTAANSDVALGDSQDEEVFIGDDERTNAYDKLKAFWPTYIDSIGDYETHRFLGAVGVHKSVHVCALVQFVRGHAYLTFVLQDGIVKRLRIHHQVGGLVLHPKSGNRFVEQNNNAKYHYKAGKNEEPAHFEIRIHKRRLVAKKIEAARE